MYRHPHVLIQLLLIGMISGCSGERAAMLPGQLADGRVRLPNGWYLSPAGRHASVGELPLNAIVTPDEHYVIVTNNGTREHSLTVIETETWTVKQTLPIPKSWLGMAINREGNRLYCSGGNDNRILVYSFDGGTLSLVDSISLGAPRPVQKLWTAGIALDEARGTVYVTGRESDSLYAVDLTSRTVARRVALPAKPYTCLLSRDGTVLFVSLWGGSAIAFLDPATLSILDTIRVGDHPCDMVEKSDDGRLFVANANHNSVSAIGIRERTVLETISTALSPAAPFGSTPNALTLGSDGTRLFAANADNNYVAVFDISRRQASSSLGFIPTGWYPTALTYLPSSRTLVVANGKGGGSRSNPRGPNPNLRNNSPEEYIGSMFRGTLSAIANPSPAELSAFTARVYENSLYTDVRNTRPGRAENNPVPARVGDPSPIKHVFYIVKENRTYDQVFGDMPEGNGDSSLCLFPESVTPNHHALARQFVLLDNFYCDAEVSADGHNWSMGGYATDYVEKSWPTSYGGRGGEYEFGGGHPVAYPSAGYLWDNCQREGVSYRTYGEWVTIPDRVGDTARALMPSLEGHVAPLFRGWDLQYSDVDRARSWAEEFDAYETDGTLPQFQVITLPNDHTEGTRRGSLTPRAYVAQNDLALGMIVDRISRSRYWRESAIFVIEDDAQNGPDHVDAHRTVALVISPWTRHGSVDSELYSTSSMVRTIELILGLPPLSQFDAAATPMYGSFSADPDYSPYTCRAVTVNLDERNPEGAYGQERSGELDFSAEDRIPDLEFSEIIWKAIRGADSPMPPPVRSAFVRVVREAD